MLDLETLSDEFIVMMWKKYKKIWDNKKKKNG